MRGILRHQGNDGRRRAGSQTRLFHRRSWRATPPLTAQPQPPEARPLRVQPGPADELRGNNAEPRLDVAAQRVRAAGGPSDEASYSCMCGYVFCAPVSASVSCPRCGTEQAW